MISQTKISPAALALAMDAILPAGVDRLLPLQLVMTATSMSKSKLYLDIKRGSFPQPVKIGSKKSAWRTSDIQRWLSLQSAKLAA